MNRHVSSFGRNMDRTLLPSLRVNVEPKPLWRFVRLLRMRGPSWRSQLWESCCLNNRAELIGQDGSVIVDLL
ncbi:hypothetical protein Q5P01_008330 [Channa striata]|uniref:Uncharacterized protein n=1 Tax=Channa striata TaxID=64152 RepID=A0AA88SUM8_CHASR|nr:hypothetical protein Q5P01_008330 [Channa striata]